MAGTKAGGLKAAATNKARHGEGFYAKIGAKGGRNGHTGGFAANHELARIAGAKGGRWGRLCSETVGKGEQPLWRGGSAGRPERGWQLEGGSGAS